MYIKGEYFENLKSSIRHSSHVIEMLKVINVTNEMNGNQILEVII
jgi:hypothetical protein